MDYQKRRAIFCRQLEQLGLDAYWLVSSANVRYLSGFPGQDSTLLLTPGRTVLITDSRYLEQAERESEVDEVVSRHLGMAETVGTLCKEAGTRRVGVTGANLSHALYEAIALAAPSVDIRSQKQGIAEKMRLRKDADEVEAIRAALRLAETAFSGLLQHIEAGRTERWLAARLDYEMRTLGADGAAFETICAVDANASLPHATPSETQVTPQSSILFDWGARLNGYCSDLTRTICVGTIPSRLDALVGVVLDARAAVLEKLKPGIRCAEADAVGRAVIAKAGYGQYFGHGLGHGVGLAVHEGPRLGPRTETILLPGMVVTVEPGIYLPGEAGVRIEEMALIVSDGHELLSRLPQRPSQFRLAGG